jgi:hypothetical protein
LCQIDQPPAHHAMDRRNRPTLNHPGDGLALDIVELGRLAGLVGEPDFYRVAVARFRARDGLHALPR